jgi:hypothetical protein
MGELLIRLSDDVVKSLTRLARRDGRADIGAYVEAILVDRAESFAIEELRSPRSEDLRRHVYDIQPNELGMPAAVDRLYPLRIPAASDRLYPLRIPAGWHVEFNTFTGVEPDTLADPDLYLSEDIFYAKSSRQGVAVDIG